MLVRMHLEILHIKQPALQELIQQLMLQQA